MTLGVLICKNHVAKPLELCDSNLNVWLSIGLIYIKRFHCCFSLYILLSKWFIFFGTQKLELILFSCKVFTPQNMHIIWNSSWIKCHIMNYNWIRIMWHMMFLQFTHHLKPRPFKIFPIHLPSVSQAYLGTTKFWPPTLFSTIEFSLLF